MSLQEDSDLLQLAQKVKTTTSEIVDHLQWLQFPQPGFSIYSTERPSNPSYSLLRDSLNDTVSDLLLLVNGPKVQSRNFLCTQHDLAAYQIAFEFDFFAAVPEDGGIELSILARKIGLDKDRLRRVMRLLCTKRVFAEVSPNVFAHTCGSIIFSKDKQLKAAGDYQLDEMFKAAADSAIAIRKERNPQQTARSPFEERHGLPLFKFYERNPNLAARFASAMAGLVVLDRQIEELRDGYPWENIKQGNVVDMGGGSGHISVALLRAFPNLSIIVQDASLDMLSQAKTQDLKGIEDRITFMQHNFFHQQPVAGARAYFIRQCLHNWCDEDCVKILRSLVPAMERCEPGTPLLINDTILPEPGMTSRFEEHSLRQVDMMMFVALGAKQRTEKEFETVLLNADKRFKIKRVHHKGTMGLLEVHLTASEEDMDDKAP